MDGRYLCHIYDMEDAKEAYDTFRGTPVRNYGEDTLLEDGTVLHSNYMWDEGARSLSRCEKCGALVMMQRSVWNDMYDGPDGYYRDWVPAASVEEADLLNILWGPMDLEQYPFRHLRGNNRSFFWTDGETPVPYDPEELRKQIREGYRDVKPELLEKLIREAGKQTEEEE